MICLSFPSPPSLALFFMVHKKCTTINKGCGSIHLKVVFIHRLQSTLSQTHAHRHIDTHNVQSIFSFYLWESSRNTRNHYPNFFLLLQKREKKSKEHPIISLCVCVEYLLWQFWVGEKLIINKALCYSTLNIHLHWVYCFATLFLILVFLGATLPRTLCHFNTNWT